MGGSTRQIGWSQEEILLQAVTKQLERLSGVIAASGSGAGGNFVTVDTVQSISSRKNFIVGAGPAATFTSSTGNTINVTATTGSGVYSTSVEGPGIEGFSVNDPGIFGYSTNSAGVFAHSQNYTALVVDSLNPANLSNLAEFRSNGTALVSIKNTGKLVLKASAAGTAALNLPLGTVPSAPVDGDIWLEANALTGLKMRIAGVTRTVTLT